MGDATIQRGLELPLFPRADVLEPLDRAGGFCPVGFLGLEHPIVGAGSAVVLRA